MSKRTIEEDSNVKNLEHSLRVGQLPFVELHGDVSAQACLHPLMTIPTWFHAIGKQCLWRKVGTFRWSLRGYSVSTRVQYSATADAACYLGDPGT